MNVCVKIKRRKKNKEHAGIKQKTLQKTKGLIIIKLYS